VTAIDLGSNSIRFLHFCCREREALKACEFVVRTAEGLHESGEISTSAIERICEAIEHAKIYFGSENFPSPIHAVATAAFRLASNQSFALNAIEARTGVRFDVIDAKKEAELTAFAVYEHSRAFTSCEAVYVLDIGGASTEIVYKDKKRITSMSFDMGIVTLGNRFGNHPEHLEAQMQKSVKAIRDFCHKNPAPLLLATAGTPTTVAALKHGLDYARYDKAKINGTMLELRDIDACYEKLMKMDLQTRETVVGTRRGDLIMVGIVMFKVLLKACNFPQTMVIDDGLREGVAHAACAQTEE